MHGLAKFHAQLNTLTNIITSQEFIGLLNSIATHSELRADGLAGIAVHRSVRLSAILVLGGRRDWCGWCLRVDGNDTEFSPSPNV
jgi:hypothetical protein